MARKRQRGRHTGRSEPGDHFAMLPVEVLESAAYTTLPYFAKAMLVAVAAQFRGKNNGDLALTWPEAQRLGIKSKGHHVAGLRLLADHQLITKTRQGGMRPLGPTLYGLTWRALDASPKYDFGTASTLAASHAWAKWEPAATEKQNNGTAGGPVSGLPADRKSAVTGLRADRKHPNNGTAGSPPSRFRGKNRNPSRLARRLTAQSDSARSTSVESKIEKLMLAQPHLTDSDIARVLSQLGVTVEQVAAVRARLALGATP